jgi:lactoylglutathione lyase
MLSFNHFNFNVCDMEKSIVFYQEALGLHVLRDRTAADGSWRIVYLGDNATFFRLELTALRDHPQKYNLGEEEFHLAFAADDYAAVHEKHRAMGCICMENPAMGIYFINDPDGYWLEIVPARG